MEIIIIVNYLLIIIISHVVCYLYIIVGVARIVILNYVVIIFIGALLLTILL